MPGVGIVESSGLNSCVLGTQAIRRVSRSDDALTFSFGKEYDVSKKPNMDSAYWSLDLLYLGDRLDGGWTIPPPHRCHRLIVAMHLVAE